jgi:hypothetical protein
MECNLGHKTWLKEQYLLLWTQYCNLDYRYEQCDRRESEEEERGRMLQKKLFLSKIKNRMFNAY